MKKINLIFCMLIGVLMGLTLNININYAYSFRREIVIEPTITPTVEPTATSTVEPTIIPTTEPTIAPTVEPTIEPTATPTVEPTIEPTTIPTVKPTATPTVKPTIKPTVKPVKVGKIKYIHTTGLSKNKVKLTWNKVKNAGYYEIYRKVSTGLTYKKIAKVSKRSYIDRNIVFNKTYRYKIVPMAKGKNNRLYKGTKGIESFKNKTFVSTSHQKYSYSEMSSDIKSLVKKYHGLVSYKVIGKTADNRKIYDVILGNQAAEKSFLVVSTLHAREYMCSLLCMNQIEYYLQQYNSKIGGKSVKELLQNMSIHYIPMANPDGVTISQFGISHIKDETLRNKLYAMKISSTSRWKSNARGVNLNLNFPTSFKKMGTPGESYSGKFAASEKETKAIIKLLKELKSEENLQGVVNYHAMGSIVFGSCSKSGAIKTNTTRMYNLARQLTGYGSSASYSGVGSGNLRDYLIRDLNVPSITLEIGRIACPGPISEYPSIWSKNKDVIFREAALFD